MANRSKVWGRELTMVYKGNEFDSCLSFLLIVKTWLYSVRPKIRNPVGFLILLNSLSYSGPVQIQCWHPSWVIRLKVQVGKQPRCIEDAFEIWRLRPHLRALICHIHPFTHRWPRLLCTVQTCSSGDAVLPVKSRQRAAKATLQSVDNPPPSSRSTAASEADNLNKCFCGTAVVNCLSWNI